MRVRVTIVAVGKQGVLPVYILIMSLICDKCHNSILVIFREKLLKVLTYYNFMWVQRRHNCSPAANFTDCVMTLYLLKVHLQTFLSIPVTQKCQILNCDALVANERRVSSLSYLALNAHAQFCIVICGFFQTVRFSEEKKLFNINWMFRFFSINFVWNFLILRRIQQHIVITLHRASCKVSVILVTF